MNALGICVSGLNQCGPWFGIGLHHLVISARICSEAPQGSLYQHWSKGVQEGQDAESL